MKQWPIDDATTARWLDCVAVHLAFLRFALDRSREREGDDA